jgi:hypothetical protein
MTTMMQCGAKIGAHTTMTLPHKRIEHGGKVYFVATFPEGDLSVHEWRSHYQEGYGGSRITFLLEDGTYETVTGPFECNDMFDFGRAEMLKEKFGLVARPTAVRIRIGKHLCRSLAKKPMEVEYEDGSLSCEPIGPRILALLDRGFSEHAEWQLEYRGGSIYPYPGTIRDYVQLCGH